MRQSLLFVCLTLFSVRRGILFISYQISNLFIKHFFSCLSSFDFVVGRRFLSLFFTFFRLPYLISTIINTVISMLIQILNTHIFRARERQSRNQHICSLVNGENWRFCFYNMWVKKTFFRRNCETHSIKSFFCSSVRFGCCAIMLKLLWPIHQIACIHICSEISQLIKPNDHNLLHRPFDSFQAFFIVWMSAISKIYLIIYLLLSIVWTSNFRQFSMNSGLLSISSRGSLGSYSNLHQTIQDKSVIAELFVKLSVRHNCRIPLLI